MGIGSFLKDVGDAAASGVSGAASALNVVDRYINPFHVEQGSAKNPGEPNRGNFLGLGDTGLGNTVVDHAVMPSVEWASQKWAWLKDNGISQPISTALLSSDLQGGWFSAHNWAVAWHAANHISPGQALFLGSGKDNPYSAEKAVDSPLLYYKPGAAYLPPDFDTWSEDRQQDYLRKTGMPAVGNRYIEELRQSSSMYKNASGIADFALSWWADPVVLGGKVISKERSLHQVVRRPEGGWSSGDINKIMDKSSMGKAIDFIYANRENPALLNNLQMAQNSGLGPRFGAIASTLQTPQEVHDFLRVGLGDVDAIARLRATNKLAAARIAQDTDRMSALDQQFTRYANNPAYQNIVRQHMQTLDDRINSDSALVQRYTAMVGRWDDQAGKWVGGHTNEIDQVNLTRWSAARAQQRTAAQAAYRANPARGGALNANRARSVTVTPLFGGAPRTITADATPMDTGFVKTRLYGLGDFFSTPVTVVRSFGNARPNGYMRLDDIDKDSIAELRGQIARIPGLDNQARLNMLNQYLGTTTEGERLTLLKQIGAMGAAKIAEKHGLDPEVGMDIYKEHLSRQAGEIDNMKRYSAAQMPITTPDGDLARVHVDEFTTQGGKVVVHPNLVTKLANSHVFQDLDEMDRVLARHSSAISALRTKTLGNPDWMVSFADGLTSLFKFATLFRLGYIPRVAGDDLAGQMARLGAGTMALRAGWGVRNAATNIALRYTRPMNAALASSAREGLEFTRSQMATLQEAINPLQAQIVGRRAAIRADLTQAGRRLTAAQTKRAAMDPATTPPAKLAAMDQLIAKHQLAVDRASRSMSTGVGKKNIRLQDLQMHYGWLEQQAAKRQATMDQALKFAAEPKAMQGGQRIQLPGGAVAPAAFEGENGQYALKQISADEAIGQMFQTNKRIIHGHLMRSFDNGGKPITAANDEELHALSWAHAINAQLMQDPLAVQAVRGASVRDMTKWMTSTAEGRMYQQRLGLNTAPKALRKGTPAPQSISTDPEDLANRAWHEVAEYMPTPEIRAKALEPGGVTPGFLRNAVPMIQRPEVHTGQVGLTQARFDSAIHKIMDNFYHVAATLPADRWSRHPLFNQLYEGHMRSLAGQLKKQGAYDTTAPALEGMATTARRLALKDMRKLVFDITHRSDAAAALRIISPFMAATTESFQRWGRIIADRPQVVGYAADFYNAPVAKGNMQDADGNDIDRNGYSYTIDPKTGKAVKRLVPKSERYIVGRMPKSLIKVMGGKYGPLAAAFGADPSSRNLKLSQNSADLVTQGDPWWNPGVGPIVQIPVNQFVKDKPKAAEVARHLQILPFGPQNGGPFGTGPAGEAASFILPSTVKNFLTSFDTSDERYQSVKLQIMQRVAFEHEELGKPMPSAKQIADMTRNYWLFSAASAFLQPMATQKADNYQFFRDQYNALRRQNPLTADDEFLKRFQESYFVFAQAMSKNVSGVPATAKAVALEKKYGDLMAANPELGALIVGPEGNGPFSPEAYSYQLNTPLAPGGAEMQRTKMSASEAMQENKRRLGWSQFTKFITGLTAQLHDRGLKSFQDKGAEDLKAQKQAVTQLLGSPTMPDGSPNQFYNEAWSQDYHTLDPLKYERLIPGLEKVATSDLAAIPGRSDLRVLQQYLGARRAVVQTLAARKKAGGSATITARSNADLLDAWQHWVDGLIEKDVNFGDLHSRYLARDLGYDGSLQGETA